MESMSGSFCDIFSHIDFLFICSESKSTRGICDKPYSYSCCKAEFWNLSFFMCLEVQDALDDFKSFVMNNPSYGNVFCNSQKRFHTFLRCSGPNIRRCWSLFRLNKSKKSLKFLIFVNQYDIVARSNVSYQLRLYPKIKSVTQRSVSQENAFIKADIFFRITVSANYDFILIER